MGNVEVTITTRERSIWFELYRARQRFIQRNLSKPWPKYYSQSEAIEFACHQIMNLRRIAAGQDTVVLPFEFFGGPGEAVEYRDATQLWEAEWRAMAAEMLTPEVGS